MEKYTISLFIFLLVSCQTEQVGVNTSKLSDNDPSTYVTGKKGINYFLFDGQFTVPIQSYKVYSTGDLPAYDPSGWTLKGTYDGKIWIVLDERKDQKFCSRFQEILCTIDQPSNYKQYLLEVSTASKDTLKIGDVLFYENNLQTAWQNFRNPSVQFTVTDPGVKGDCLYQELVQDPQAYIQYHARKVAEILYFSAGDPMPDVETIRYTLREYDGVSAKSGNPPAISIVYSTKHIEKSAGESLFKLDFETRGVLYHELVHGYQFEPKGIGTYSTNKEFWACIEGVADAVRAQAGYFDWNTRKPGGHWLDGYRTTGFFLQWLTTKDPDAIRKFNRTALDLEVWSFDKAIRSIFGPTSGIEIMWNEYQAFLQKQEK